MACQQMRKPMINYWDSIVVLTTNIISLTAGKYCKNRFTLKLQRTKSLFNKEDLPIRQILEAKPS